jgi:DNA-binding transcriptional MerR regulator
MRTQPASQDQTRPEPSAVAGLRIGDVATSAGVSPDTLRFYERRGLLRPVRRRASGYREYTSETIRLVRFIRRAQSLGFTLAEVEELIRLREKAWAGSAPALLRDAADAKMREIDRRVRELRALRGALAGLLESCDAACAPGRRTASTLECPLVEALETAAGQGDVDIATTSQETRRPAPGRPIARKKKLPASTSSSSNRRRT